MSTLAELLAAHERVKPNIRRTPVQRSRTLSERLGAEVFLKLELFQKTGSFKVRAAFGRMLRLTEAEKARGAVAVSGGNFAQAVAYAGRVLGIDTVVCMTESAPRNSQEATRNYGAHLELFPDIEAAFAAAEKHRQAGRSFLHPFEDEDAIAGNASLGLEMLQDIPNLTDVVVSVGGGGLMSGVILAVKAVRPEIRIWTVETEGADALDLALKAGQVVRMRPTSLAKTLGAPYVAAGALDLARRHVQKHMVVTDREAYEALKFLAERTKVLPELSAACTWAAAEKLREEFGPGRTLGLILCGGNVSLDELSEYRARFG